MKEYIIVIVGSALLAMFADMISPENWKKYIRIITGIVIICVIISPISKMRDIDLFVGFDNVGEAKIENSDYQKELVIDKFSELIEQDVIDKVYEKYGKEVSVRADIKLNSDLQIEGVERIIVDVDYPINGLVDMISFMYGIEKERVIINE